MTITTNDVRDEYTASAAQTVFNYTFKIFADGQLNVYITPAGQEPNDSSDITTAYTIDPSSIGDEDGGFLTLDSGTTNGDRVTIVSDIPEARTTDYQNSGDFLPDVVNDDFDTVVSLVKQVEDKANRTLAFQNSLQNATALTLPAPSAGLYMVWNGAETGLENTGVPSVIVPGDISGTLTALKSATNLTIGDFVVTTGYLSSGDGGDNKYEIVAAATGTDDGGSFIDLAGSGLQAKALFPGGEIYVMQWGAIGDGATDCTSGIQAAIDYAFNTGNNNTVRFIAGRYLVTSTVFLHNGAKVEGSNIDNGGPFGATDRPNALADSKGTVILFRPTTQQSFMQMKLPLGGSAAYSGVGIRGLNVWGNTTVDSYHYTLFGDSEPVSSNSLYCFDFNLVQASVVENCQIDRFVSGVREGDRCQENTFSNVIIGFCQEYCVVYTDLTTGVEPTSTVWDKCIFRTALGGVEQKATLAAPSGDSLQIRFVDCYFEDFSENLALIPIGAKNWEFRGCYGESLGVDTSVSTRGAFRVGYAGLGSVLPDVNLNIIAGQYSGPSTAGGTFLSVDTSNGVNIHGGQAKRFSTCIEVDSTNTRDRSIYLMGFTFEAITTFLVGDRDKLVGVFRNLGLDNPSTVVQIESEFMGNPGATLNLIGSVIRMGDSGTASVNPGGDGTASMGLNSLRWSENHTKMLNLQDGITAPTATVGEAKLYVDTADGDLKIIFGDGTIKTIVTDT